MVQYFPLIVAFTGVKYAVELWLDLRQHRLFRREGVPAEVTAHTELSAKYNPDTFAKSQRYGADRSMFGMLHDAYDTALSLFTLFAGVLPGVWSLSRRSLSSVTSHEIPVSLAFLTASVVIQWVCDLPWALWGTFVLEERYGFNKMTVRLFVTDTLKSAALFAAIGFPLISAAIAVIRWTGPSFWVWLWLLMLVVSLVMQVIYPIVILPIFNKLTPLEDGPLKDAVSALATRVNFSFSQVLVMDGSKRSGHSNAFFIGFGRHKRIVLYDTLISQMSTEEVVAVLGHELGHWKHNHIWKLFGIGELHTLFYLAVFGRFLDDAELYKSFGFTSERPAVVGLALFAMVYEAVGVAVSFAMNILSRRFEYQADAFATELGQELTPALVKLNAENLSALIVDPIYSAYHNSHPTLLERIAHVDRVKSRMEKKST